MSKQSNYDLLINKLDRFTRKYYVNQLIRGTLYSVATILAVFLLITQLENYFLFSTSVRKGIYFGFITLSALAIFGWMLIPILKIFKLGSVISHEKAAEMIGTHFSDVKDKLLNILQLKSGSTDYASAELIEASIDQKIDGIKLVPFRTAIDLGNNKQYLKYALPPIFLLAIMLFARPSLITEPVKEIVNYNEEIERPAPFSFALKNQELEAVQYDDFLVEVAVSGEVIPHDANIIINDFPYKLSKTKTGEFTYKFNKLQKSTDFYFEASGFKSKNYTLNVIPKPAIVGFSADIDYPAYTGKKDEILNNTGDMVLPAGTKVDWGFESQNTDKVLLQFGNEDSLITTHRNGKELFTYGRRIYKDASYTVHISSEKVKKGDSIAYQISVVPDLYPEISVKEFKDSSNNKLIYFLGEASDDYGLKEIKFVYSVTGKNSLSKAQTIQASGSKKADKYTYTWDLNDLELENGDKLVYHFEAWDNDGIRGSKVSKTNSMTYELPSLDELEAMVDQSKEDFEEDMEANLKEAKELKEEVKELKEKIVQKKDLNWEDRQQIQKMLERQKELQNSMENSQNKFEENNKKEDEFKDITEEMAEKKQKLEEMMEEMMTEEMKEKLEEMEDQLEEMTPEELMEKLEEMELTDEQMEREMERMMELLKQMEMEEKMAETAEKLEELAEKERELAEKTKENESENFEEEKKEQEEIKEEFEELKEDMEEIKEMAEELDKDAGAEEQEEMQEEAEQKMEDGMQQMESKDKKKASQSQQDAAQKMQEMANQMQQQMQEMESEQAEEDMQAIRQLLENLIDMSMGQEVVMDELAETSVNNPKYVELVQNQYKLKDDFQIVEDSLVALSKRVMQIESFIIKELTEIEKNFDDGIDFLEARKKRESSVNQQYVMTSTNNLALMLSETMQQMQQQMMNSMPGSGSCNKPGGMGAGMSGMKKMQKQLNEQMQKMMEDMQKGKQPGGGKAGGQDGEKPGEKPGGSMSKEFAETARMQEAIRDALKKFNEENNKDGDGDLGDLEKIMEEMEKTEEDLVNKRITQEMIKRQQEIMSRLLEAEEAEKQRGFEEKRQGQTAQEMIKNIPPEIEEYLKKRESEVELYKTVAPEMKNYYKKLVEKYFNNISF